MDTGKDAVRNTLSDVEYLLDEIEALKYVVHTVPVYERPGENLSICELIRLIDHAQTEYFRPNIEKITSSKDKNLKSPVIQVFVRDFKSNRLDPEAEKEKGIESYLSKIIKHRASLISFLSGISYESHPERKKISEVLNEMVLFERDLLKQVADRVLSIQNDQ